MSNDRLSQSQTTIASEFSKSLLTSTYPAVLEALKYISYQSPDESKNQNSQPSTCSGTVSGTAHLLASA
jgi:hypothetical protein